MYINDTIYSFDIETTTEHDTSNMYLTCFSCGEFSKLLKNNKATNIDRIGYFRDWSGVNSFLLNLNTQAVRGEYLTYICVHNLSYEMSFRYNLLPLISKIGIEVRKDGTQKIIAKNGSSNSIQFIQIGNLCFIDTLLITGKSIKTIGAELGYPKLDYNYSTKRYSYTPITEEELSYCFRDTEISLLGLISICKNYEWCNTTSKICKTRTSFTRKNNEKITNKKEKNAQIKRCKALNNIDLQIFNTIQRSYFGGYTHACGYYAGKVVENTHSIDLSSDYPSQIVHRYHPASTPQSATAVQQNKAFCYLFDLSKSQTLWIELLKPCIFYNCKHKEIDNKGFIFDVDFYGVEVKTTQNKNIFPLLSSGANYFHFTKDSVTTSSKVLVDIDTTVTDNGRIYKSDHINVNFLDIDLLLFMSTYKFKKFNINKGLVYDMQKPTEYFVKIIDYYASIKTELKSLNRKCENHENITENDITKLNISEEVKKSLLNAFKQKNLQEFYTYVASVYQNSKADLNGQYGINVENPIKEMLTIDSDNLNSTKELPTPDKMLDTIHKDKFKSYLIGSYITAYARASLLSMGVLLDKFNLTTIYSDTDSWKVMGQKEVLQDILDMWNSQYKNIVESSKLTNFATKFGIGYFDYESTYDKFCTIGCKRYVYKKDNYIKATISGLPKASQIFQKYYGMVNKDFNKMINDIFHFNVVFKDVKILSNYVNVGKWDAEVQQFSGVLLQNCDVSLSEIVTTRDFNTDKVYEYFDYIRNSSVKLYLSILHKYFKNDSIKCNKTLVKITKDTQGVITDIKIE